jgi:hypothetical protein
MAGVAALAGWRDWLARDLERTALAVRGPATQGDLREAALIIVATAVREGAGRAGGRPAWPGGRAGRAAARVRPHRVWAVIDTRASERCSDVYRWHGRARSSASLCSKLAQAGNLAAALDG